MYPRFVPFLRPRSRTPIAAPVAPARGPAVVLAILARPLGLAIMLPLLGGSAAAALPRMDVTEAIQDIQRLDETKELWVTPDLAKESKPDYFARLEKEAAAGNVKAQATLGVCYQGGHGVPKDLAKAAEWYELAVKAGHAGAETNLAQLCELGAGVPRDPTRAHELYLAAANQGVAAAQVQVGLHCAFGKGVPQDWREARSWYEKAAAQGDLAALNNLGNIYLWGRGVPVNFAQARKYFQRPADAELVSAQFGFGFAWAQERNFAAAAPWLRRSAENGSALGQLSWAEILFEGNAVPRDLVRATYWARKAAVSLSALSPRLAANAHAELAKLLLAQPNPDNNAEAFREASIAAQAGNAYGENYLGVCYYRGAGVAKDPATATKWYLLAAQQKQPEAACCIGLFYEEGLNLPRDSGEAVKWFQISAEAGNPTAEYHLGRCYRDGLGVPINLPEALKWLRLAAPGLPNNRNAQNDLAQLEGQMKNTDSEAAYQRGIALVQAAIRDGSSMDEAVKALTEAANLGHPFATIALSHMYRLGEGVPKDEAQADALIARVEGSSKPAIEFQIGVSFLPGANQPPVEKDIDRAIGFLQRAADQSYGPAPAPLGYCYMTASPAHQDLVAAFVWLSLGASQGDANSRMYLERIRPRLTNAQTAEALRRLSEFRPRNAVPIPTGPAVTATRP